MGEKVSGSQFTFFRDEQFQNYRINPVKEKTYYNSKV